ncbi:MAG: hypothetical protein ACYC27_18170 [Armatimonadota bacterium]
MPPKFEERAKERIRKYIDRYIPILQAASQRGISEEDTSTIVQSMMVDILGYDRFSELTGQFAVKGRWADWAVRVDDNLYYFIEVKSLGTKLRDKDLFQVTSYSRQHSLDWAILSTGDIWECHRVASGQDTEEFFSIKMLDESQPIDEKINYFYLLSREAFSKGILDESWSQRECFRPDKLVSLILSDEIISTLRKLVNRDNPGKRIEVDMLRDAVARNIIRGDLYVASQSLNAVPVEESPKKSKARKPAVENTAV